MLDFVNGGADKAVDNISNLKLLVVDDDDFILNISTRILGHIGYKNVTTVSDGRLAVEQLVTPQARILICPAWTALNYCAILPSAISPAALSC